MGAGAAGAGEGGGLQEVRGQDGEEGASPTRREERRTGTYRLRKRLSSLEHRELQGGEAEQRGEGRQSRAGLENRAKRRLPRSDKKLLLMN